MKAWARRAPHVSRLLPVLVRDVVVSGPSAPWILVWFNQKYTAASAKILALGPASNQKEAGMRKGKQVCNSEHQSVESMLQDLVLESAASGLSCARMLAL